jgi:hypothetical protein
MDRRRLRAFIAAIFAHHGWELPETDGDSVTAEAVAKEDPEIALTKRALT